MAFYGIVSDIHGNLQALQAALKFLLEEREVDAILCLGDLVGYNAAPDACVELLQRLPVLSVAGNHDLIAVGALDSERAAVRAAFALRRTRKVLSEASRQVLAALPLRRVIEDEILLIHGGLGDVCQYVTTPARVEENHARMLRELPRARICFFGHTHEQKLYEIEKGAAVERAPGQEVVLDGPGRTFFVNPGSLDAARKNGDKQAELALFDSSRRTLSFHRLAYDHERSERSAVEQGYRMTPMDERLYRAGRTLLRGKRRALAELRRILPFLEQASRRG
jgi:predicted phosphodiesterase